MKYSEHCLIFNLS